MRRLLLVEGQRPNPALLAALGRAGHRVVVAGDADSAIDLTSRLKLRTIICADKIGGEDGLVLLERLRKLQPDTRRILINSNPRRDLKALVERGLVHDSLPSLGSVDRLLDCIAGVPDTVTDEPTPVVSTT